MRFDLTYRTRFRYSDLVTENQNEVRAAPLNDERQRVLAYRIDTTPAARVLHYTDSWGTGVDSFGVRNAHDHLVVTVSASVETSAPAPPPSSVPLSALADPAFVGAHWEYLHPTRHTTASSAVVDLAARCAEGSDDVGDVVSCLAGWVGSELSYEPGATTIGVTTDEVLDRRAGVCQDFSHLLVAMCRAVGIPARYVSGYFFAASDDAPALDEELHTVVVQTHAWVEVAIPGAGWRAVDPTNLEPVAERHIVIGRGREYDDVPPFRGVYTGDAEAEVTATVTIRRLDEAGVRLEVTSDEVLQAFPGDLAPTSPGGSGGGQQ